MSTPFRGFDEPTKVTQERPARIPQIAAVEEPSSFPRTWNQWKKLLSSVSMSILVHALILFTLSWFYFDLPNRNVFESILFMAGSGTEPLGGDVDFGTLESNDPTFDAGESDQRNDSPISQGDVFSNVSATFDTDSIPSTDRVRVERSVATASKSASSKPASKSKAEVSGKSDRKKGGNAEGDGQHADHFMGRSPMGRKALLKRMGGTDASEAAVARGLVWLKNHQYPDGSWNFNHLNSPRCDCSQAGRMGNNPNAATAMALLAFLGAGQTHEAGDYKPEVQRGIDFLTANGMPAEKGIRFNGQMSGPPTYYTHGLVTIALSEAFAMTGDAQLRPTISGAIDFLVATQEYGGGWRYFPGQPGDTSVVAWQLMALKSAQFSRIPVPRKVFNGIDRFLGTVSSMRGSQFAYLPDRKDAPTASMTAAGLLCRMYLDGKSDDARIRAGIRYLDEHGPDVNDMYYNYYATQVMHHWGGPEWERWNNVMREHLIATQIRDGHTVGSWDVADHHGMPGGRVYMTTLALLTLEVYYRHLPLYQKDRIDIPLMEQIAEPKVR